MTKKTSQNKLVTTFASLFKGTSQKMQDSNAATITATGTYIEGDGKSPSSNTRTLTVQVKLSSADPATKQAFADSVSNFWGSGCASPFDATGNDSFFNNLPGHEEQHIVGKIIEID